MDFSFNGLFTNQKFRHLSIIFKFSEILDMLVERHFSNVDMTTISQAPCFCSSIECFSHPAIFPYRLCDQNLSPPKPHGSNLGKPILVFESMEGFRYNASSASQNENLSIQETIKQDLILSVPSHTLSSQRTDDGQLYD